VLGLSWHPAGNYLAVVCSVHDIHVWDLKDLKRMTQLADLKGCVNAGLRLAFTPDGDRLLSTGFEALVRVWDWRTGRKVLQRAGGSNLQFCRDGRLLIQVGARLELVELASGTEHRTFVQQSQVGKDLDYWHVASHPQVLMVAVAMSDGTRLFDLQTGVELARLPPNAKTLAFDAHGALPTNGAFGLLRWPIQPKGSPDQWQVGPPDFLLGGSFHDMACDRKGEVIGQAAGDGAILVRPGKRPIHLGTHADARHITISPGGEYAATGDHNSDEGIKIWDIETGQPLMHLPLGARSGGSFSPDGQWLAVWGTRGRRILKVGTWEQRALHDWDAFMAFFPDGSLLATTPRRGVIAFLESSTGRELAVLEDPDEAVVGSIAFTPEATTMVVSSAVDHALHIWDLRAIRNQLAEMGLDWDQPPYPQAGQSATLPLQVTVNLGYSFVDPRTKIGLSSFRLALNPFDFEAYFDRGRAYAQQKAPRKAIADYSMALALMPADHKSRGEVLLRRSNNYRALNDQVRRDADLQQIAELDLTLPEGLRDVAAEQCNELAWRYVTGSEKQRDPKKALPLAQKAVKLNGDEWRHRNTLGVAYYRLGQYPRAADTLERRLSASWGEFDAFDLFFLAMCHARTGAADKARSCFDQAVRWVQQNSNKMQPGWAVELKAFQAEAEELLKQPPNPGR
jgi:WD40 repeat protein/tetratricopeptide (TPR) repeat protein